MAEIVGLSQTRIVQIEHVAMIKLILGLARDEEIRDAFPSHGETYGRLIESEILSLLDANTRGRLGQQTAEERKRLSSLRHEAFVDRTKRRQKHAAPGS